MNLLRRLAATPTNFLVLSSDHCNFRMLKFLYYSIQALSGADSGLQGSIDRYSEDAR